MRNGVVLSEFGEQESPAGFEDPVHLGNCSLLIILSYVVQGEGARHRVEAGVSERKPLRESGLKVCRQSPRRARAVASLIISAAASIPSTDPEGATRSANTIARRPPPHPTSRTRSPSRSCRSSANVDRSRRPRGPSSPTRGRRSVPSGSGDRCWSHVYGYEPCISSASRRESPDERTGSVVMETR